MNALNINWDEALHTGIIGPLVKMGFDNDTIESMAYQYNYWIASSDITQNATMTSVPLYSRLCSVDKMVSYRKAFSSWFSNEKKWATRAMNFVLSKPFKQHMSDFGEVDVDNFKQFEQHC